MKLRIKDIQDEQVTIEWDKVEGVQEYCVYWSDKDTPTMQYRLTTYIKENDTCATFYKSVLYRPEWRYRVQ